MDYTRKPYIVGCIFARGGSKGIPMKNIRPLAGMPLIDHSIEKALQSSYIQRVIVSTDDRRIAEVAGQFGAEVPFMRPAALAQDNSPEWAAWQHAIREMHQESASKKMDIFVTLPPTSPLRSVEDINNCIEAFIGSDADIVITVTVANRHPSFNMVQLNESQDAQLVMPLEKSVYRRQDAPAIYDMTTVAYVASPDFILHAQSIFDGHVKAVVIPKERAVDIDTELDFAFAEFLLARQTDRPSNMNTPQYECS